MGGFVYLSTCRHPRRRDDHVLIRLPDDALRIVGQHKHLEIDANLTDVRVSQSFGRAPFLGHGMRIPVPGARSAPALAALRQTTGRLRFAHADLSAYSVFEEAFTLGIGAAA